MKEHLTEILKRVEDERLDARIRLGLFGGDIDALMLAIHESHVARLEEAWNASAKKICMPEGVELATEPIHRQVGQWR